MSQIQCITVLAFQCTVFACKGNRFCIVRINKLNIFSFSFRHINVFEEDLLIPNCLIFIMAKAKRQIRNPDKKVDTGWKARVVTERHYPEAMEMIGEQIAILRRKQRMLRDELAEVDKEVLQRGRRIGLGQSRELGSAAKHYGRLREINAKLIDLEKQKAELDRMAAKRKKG